jgi:folate-binding protein YgfZ
MDDFTAVRRPDFALGGIFGPAAAERLDAIGLHPGSLATQPPLSHAEIEPSATPSGSGSGSGTTGPIWLVRARELGADGFWIGGRRDDVAAATQRLAAAGVPLLSAEAAEAARIAAREPKPGVEITSDYFPMEVGLGDAIDYGKGCYLGQEPIVRIRDRGHINWRLVGLDVEGPRDPAPGDTLETDAKPKAGRITSAARLPDGRGVALGLAHISVPDGGAVRVRHGDEVIAALVRG